MALLKIDQSQQKALSVATVAALFVGVWFMQSYIMLILLAVLAAVLFDPVYKWLLRKGRKRGSAAMLTFFASVLAVIIPIIFVSVITVYQIDSLVSTLSSGSYPQDINSVGNSIINSINSFLADIGVAYRLSIDAITQAISTAAQNFSKTIVNGILSSVTGFFALITTSIIYIYVYLSITKNQKVLLDTVKKLNPLGDKVSDLYIERIYAMTKATVRGQFIIAFCQGTASAIGLAIAGMDNLFFFFWMLLTVLSIVPLGAGIVTIPIGIVMILTGNVWQGVLVILNHLIIVTNIDNILRPKLVPAEARLDPALMILAVFAGMGMFGFFGIVLGPVLMIILVTTVQMYLEVFKSTASIGEVGQTKSGGALKKLRFWKKTA